MAKKQMTKAGATASVMRLSSEAANEKRLRRENPFYDYDQSAIGIESNINRKNLEREIEDARREAARYPSGSKQDRAATRRWNDLRDSMRIFDAQLDESRQAFMSNPNNNPKIGATGIGPGGEYTYSNETQPQMQMPPQSGQARPPQQRQGQPKGMPQEMAQSPAMAQARRPNYGQFNQNIVNNLNQREAYIMDELGGRPTQDLINRNPYVNEQWNNPYSRRQRATEYSMANYQDPNAMYDYYQNLNF